MTNLVIRDFPNVAEILNETIRTSILANLDIDSMNVIKNYYRKHLKKKLTWNLWGKLLDNLPPNKGCS